MSIIRSYVRIENYRVWVNGHEIFAYDGEKEIGKFLKALYKHLGMKYMKFFKMDNLSKAGLLAAEILVGNKELTNHYKAEEIGITMANSVASLDVDRKYYDTIKDAGNYFPSPALFVYTLPNIVLGEICIRHGFKGENAFFVQQDFDSDFFHFYNRELMEQKGQKALISGWADVEGKHLKVVLFLIEKEGKGMDSSPKNMDTIYS